MVFWWILIFRNKVIKPNYKIKVFLIIHGGIIIFNKCFFLENSFPQYASSRQICCISFLSPDIYINAYIVRKYA